MPQHQPQDQPITAGEVRFKFPYSEVIVIHHGTVERFPIHEESTEDMWEEFARIMDFFWKLDDVHISLENRNGVTIREVEKRGGIDVRCGA
jgi:hypothetical protein